MKKIKGYEEYYGITSCGKVWSFISNKFLTLSPINNGYLRAKLLGKDYLVHRLVAEAYLPNPDNLSDVDHLDGNRTNNCINNLEWVSHETNIRRAHNVKVRNVETGEEFDNFIAAAASVNRHKSGISACIRGKQKTCGGYHWEVC